MNKEQIKAALRLIQLMDADPVAQADTETFGDWYAHLTDHIAEAVTET